MVRAVSAPQDFPDPRHGKGGAAPVKGCAASRTALFPRGAPAVSSRGARPPFLPAGHARLPRAHSSAVFYPFTGSQPSGYASGVKTFASSLERYSAPFHQPHSSSANAVPAVIVSGMIRQPSL